MTAASDDISFRITLADEAATARLAGRLAKLARIGDMLALAGDLGSGKTSFARAFIRALGHPDEEVPSPTFTLAQSYDTEAGTIWHFDLYRLSGPEEAAELGLDEALGSGISLVEWPERLGRMDVPGRLDVALSQPPGAEEDARIATLTPGAGWIPRLKSEFGESEFGA